MIPTSKQRLNGIDGSTVREVAEAAGFVEVEHDNQN